MDPPDTLSGYLMFMVGLELNKTFPGRPLILFPASAFAPIHVTATASRSTLRCTFSDGVTGSRWSGFTQILLLQM